MRDPRLAELVAGAFRYFEGTRYELYAWCVMPNHAHVIVEPVAGHSLSSVVHSWKSYTAHAARRITGEAGSLWQREYYDRVIRDEEELIATMRYVDENPAKAGLVNWRWVWCRERRW
jgi:REP element-mobilizing transposase RayT